MSDIVDDLLAMISSPRRGWSEHTLARAATEINTLRASVSAATPIVRQYAHLNKRWEYDGRVQDPCGAHAWLERSDAAPAAQTACGMRAIIAWLYEDTLPPEYPYDMMYPHSRVDGVRMFPVFGPTDESVPIADPLTSLATRGDQPCRG